MNVKRDSCISRITIHDSRIPEVTSGRPARAIHPPLAARRQPPIHPRGEPAGAFERTPRVQTRGAQEVGATADGRDTQRRICARAEAGLCDPLRPRLEVEIEAISDWQFDVEYYVINKSSDQEARF
jgi:hypothetical protein